MATLTVELPDLEHAISVAGPAIDFGPALRIVEVLMVSETKENFRLQRDPHGKAWAPHAPSTRRRRGPRAKILQDKGTLRASIESAFSVRGPLSLTWGTRVKHGPPHQYGAPARNIPQRQFIGFNDRIIKRIDAIIVDHAAAQVASRMGGR